MPIQIDILAIIPNSIKTQVRDSLVDFVTDQAKKYASDEIANKIKRLRSDGAFNKKFEQGLQIAVERFIEEYQLQDEDLVAAIASDSDFFKNDEVQEAILELVKHPGGYLQNERITLLQSFATVFPERINRNRVDRAITFLLKCLAEELWHLPELQPIYSLQFQRMTAEATRQQVEIQRAQLQTLTELNIGIRDALVQLTDKIAEQKLLPSGDNDPDFDQGINAKVIHNLPHPDYGKFIGREEQLAQVYRILRPYPHSQHALVTIDGIGGIGKSTLALEIAHRYLRNYDRIPAEERFDAIIWASAKQTILTAEGISPRKQFFRTLDDIYTTIAVTLQREEITRAIPESQTELVRQALTHQRTLLIIDNLETVDDEDVITFLRELPAPTKAIVTTRHRLDVAYPVRLTGMSWNDAQRLIAHERKKKLVELSPNQFSELYRRTGGVPLALVWSIALMGFGYEIDVILERLGAPSGDVAQFCFQSAVDNIRGQSSYTALLALSLFANSGSRRALLSVTELSPLELSDGLVDLERLSLVNKYKDRFSLLPLTKAFALAELKQDQTLEHRFGMRWADFLINTFERPDDHFYWRFKGEEFYQEGENIREALEWSYLHGSADQVFDLSLILMDFLDDTGRWNEMLSYCDRASSLAKSIQNSAYFARFLNSKGWILEQRGKYEEAIEVSQTALEQFRAMKDQRGEAKMLQRLSALYRKCEDFDSSMQKCDQAMELAKQLDDPNLTILIEHEYGKLDRAQRNWSQAKEHFLAVQKWFQDMAEQTPHDEQLAWGVAGHLAIVEYHLGNPQEAKDLCLRSLEFFEGYGTRGYMAVLNYRLALAEEALGEFAAASEHVQKALKWFDRLGMKPDYDKALPLLQRLEEN